MKQVRLKAVVLVASVGASLFFSWFFAHVTIDDAYISYRYADNFVNGDGLTWNPSDDPVEGYSNFLWVIAAATLIKLSIPVVGGMKLFGLILSLANLFLIYKIAYRVTKSELWSAVAVLFATVTPAWGFWAVGGLENHLFMFYLYLGMYLLFRDLQSKTTPLFALAFAGAAMTRHEGAVLFIFALVLLAARHFDFRARSITKEAAIRLLTAALLFGAVYTPYFLWRVYYYGDFFPNTYYAKTAAGAGIPELWAFLKYFSPFLLMAIPSLLRIEDGFRVSPRKEHVYLWMIVLISALLLVNRDPVMGNYHRFFLHLIPFVYILCIPLWRGMIRVTPALAALIALFLVVPLEPLDLADNANTYETYARGMEDAHIRLGRWIEANTPTDTTIAITDAGAVPFHAKRRTIDLWGLNDEHIAQDGFDLDYFWSQDPDVIILFSIVPDQFSTDYRTEDAIFDDPTFKANFELIRVDNWKNAAYGLMTFARKGSSLTGL